MSAAELDKLIRERVLTTLEGSKDTAREQMNKGVTVIEISPELLKKNNPNLKDTRLREVRTLARKFIKALFVSNPKIRPYTSDITYFDIAGGHSYYIQEGTDRLLIIGPSFASIRNIVSKTSKNDKIAKDPFIGSFVGKQNVYDDNDTIIGTKDVTLSRLDIGHTANIGQEGKNTVAGKRIEDALGIIDSINRNPIQTKYLKQLEKIHTPYRVTFDKGSLTDKLVGKLHFVYTVPQDRALNRALGTKEKKVLTTLINFIAKAKGSKSLEDLADDRMVDLFLDRKKRTYRSSAKVKGSMDINVGRIPVISKSIKFQLREKTGRFTSLINLQSLLNTRLHDQIRNNMGKGSATEKLNYRTGRFASSANILSLQQSKEKVIANYTFMRSPYDVFMPEGRLYRPGRDPEKIINRSIRQLATQLVFDKFKIYPNLVEGV